MAGEIDFEVTPPPPAPPAASRSPRLLLGVVALLVVAILAAGGAWAFVAGPFSTTALALSFDQGKTYRYKIHMSGAFTFGGASGSSSSVNLDFSAVESLVSQSVDKAGVTTVTVKLDEVQGTIGGKAVPATLPKAFTMRISKDGKLLDFNVAGATSSLGGGSPSGLDQFSAILPDNKVHVGDTWTKTIEQPNPFGQGSLKLTTNSKLLRFEDLSGAHAAVVNTTGKGDMDLTINLGDLVAKLSQGTSSTPLPPQLSSIVMHMTGTDSIDRTSWLDPAKHELLKSSGSVSEDASATFSGLPAGVSAAAAKPIPIHVSIKFELTKA
jgi:hypothetical protein